MRRRGGQRCQGGLWATKEGLSNGDPWSAVQRARRSLVGVGREGCPRERGQPERKF